MKTGLFLVGLLLVAIMAGGLIQPVVAAVTSSDNTKTDVWEAMRDGGLTDIGDNVYGGEDGKDFRVLTFVLIRRLLEVLGVVFLVLTVYAGFKWMTAGGNTDQIDEAKTLLRNAVIGLAIILCSYAITLFVINTLLLSTATS